MGWRMHLHRLVMGAVVLAGLVMIVGYLLLSGVPSSFLLSGALVQTSDVTTIVVDAGHGGYDSGSISTSGVLEKDVTLEVALLVGERLQEAGYAVVYTRTGDEVSWPSDNSADLAARVETGFISDTQDIDYILSHSRLLADAIAQGVNDSLEAE